MKVDDALKMVICLYVLFQENFNPLMINGILHEFKA